MSEKNKFYITTPIYYVNDKPHIGHAYTTVAADVLARYNRILGKEVFFLAGTDEHGAKVAQAAEKANKDPQVFCDETASRYERTWDSLNISNDVFARTTNEKHKKSVEKFYTLLKNKGAIYKDKYEGLYCTGCEKFITEKELVDGKCSDHQKKPEKISEENYFFKLKDYLEEVKKKIESNEIKVEPEHIRKEVLGLFKQDLQDFSISRESVKWGIKLPFDENQVSYVWIEALQIYISTIGYENDQKMFNKFWPADIQLMAKDIIKFHIIYWPAMLIASDLPVPKNIFAHGFFSIDGQKMSKTLGNVVDPNDLIKKYGTDATRYLILSQFPFGQDGDIKADKFDEQYNNQLANNLGNLFSRVLKLAKDIRDINEKEDKNIKEKVEKTWITYEKVMNNFQIDKGLGEVRSLLDFSNKYIEEQKPWELKKNNVDKFDSIMLSFLEMLRHIAWMIRPFMVETSNKIFDQLGIVGEKKISFQEFKKWRDPEIKDLKEGISLFPRI